jgi:ribosomal-protein-alanine N-acetyltransferase
VSLVETDGNVSIVATTLAMLEAEDIGGDRLAALLGVKPPASWPPLYNDQDTRDWMRGMMEGNPREPGFGSWYIVVDGKLVGNCGFKGPPGADGMVEIGYSVVEAEQRKGFGSAAIALLLRYAFRDPRVTVVTAETVPELVASQGVLTHSGFSLISRTPNDEFGEILRYSISR